MSPGPELLRHQLGQRAFGLVRAEVDHHRHVRERAGFDRALDRRPLGAGVVRRLDADDQPWMPARHVRGRLRLHVREVLLERAAAHAVADDVEKGEDAGLRAIDDALLEILEVAPAGAAGIGDRRHADAQREAVRIDAVVAGVRAPLARAGVDVRVDVDRAPA